MAGVFINYRGDDSQLAGALIYSTLVDYFGESKVFLDCRSIGLGDDFTEVLLGRLRTSSVLLCVIGPHWLTLTNSDGERRIDQDRDWVHREIREAFAQGVHVVPVLTDDAHMPPEASLPSDIARLSRRQFYQLRRRYFKQDLADLAARLSELDSDLAVAVNRARTTVSSADHIPRQLPAGLVHFVGREDGLAKLSVRHARIHDHTSNIIVISGTAGVGKTTLAVHWAHCAAAAFPDGQLFVNLHGFDYRRSRKDPAEVIRGLLEALGFSRERIPSDDDAQEALYRSIINSRRMLIVLDNARDAEQVRPLLPGSRSTVVIVTSRAPLTGLVVGQGALALPLDLMSEAESAQLLSSRIGLDRATAEPEAVREIITSCARLPLALAVVAARISSNPGFPLAALADELRDLNSRLDAIAVDDSATDVRAALSMSYRTTSASAARLFRTLSLHPGPDITASAAGSLAALPVASVRQLLAELTRASLITEHAPGRYTCHELLRAYAHQLALTSESEHDRLTAIRRTLDHYLRSGDAAALLLNPHRESIETMAAEDGVQPDSLADLEAAMTWFEAERANILALIELAAELRIDNVTWQLAWLLTTFLERQGHWHDWAKTQSMALEAANRLAVPALQARSRRSLGGAYMRLHRLNDASTQLRIALDLFEPLNDHVGQAHSLLMMARILRRQDRGPEALRHAEHALDLYTAAGHLPGQANAMNSVGWYHARLGHLEQAISLCIRALTLNIKIGNVHWQAASWDSLGYAQHHLGRTRQAAISYHRSIVLYRQVGDRYAEAEVLTHLGHLWQSIGSYAQATEIWQQALSILEKLGHPDAGYVRAVLDDLPKNHIDSR